MFKKETRFALDLIAKNPGFGPKDIRKALNGKKADRIVKPLKDLGLIRVIPKLADDCRKSVYILTEKGAEWIDKSNRDRNKC